MGVERRPVNKGGLSPPEKKLFPLGKMFWT